MKKGKHLYFATAISGRQITEHRSLIERLDEVELTLNTSPSAPALTGIRAALARRLLADIARFLTREPTGRTLMRLPPGTDIAQAALLDCLRDARAGLEHFHYRHSDFDSDTPDHWLVIGKDDVVPRS